MVYKDGLHNHPTPHSTKFLFITPQSGIYSTEVRHFAHRFSTILLIDLSYLCLSSGLSNTKSGIYSIELPLSFFRICQVPQNKTQANFKISAVKHKGDDPKIEQQQAP